ncbi:MAG: Type II secretion system protein D precursor [Syntrophorhabdaceae bacterium PtaU1.Bin034]|nr:MAG: Type II secretion system protein D precursor [Syntrophorhabdaceae bacterium PtaU1.Bin034]
MKIVRIVLLATLVLALQACAGLREELRKSDPNYGVRKPEVTGVPMPTQRDLEEQPAKVRIIKGTPVAGPDEARRLLAANDQATRLGLDLVLRSFALRDAQVRVVTELLTELSGFNVVASGAVADRRVSIYLKDVRVRDALEALCRLNDLWFREGKGIITLMTREEYVRDLEARQSDQTRAFYVRYSNALDMAKVIKAIMGDEVRLTVIDDEKVYGHLDPSSTTSTGLTSTASTTGRVSDTLGLSPAQLEKIGVEQTAAGRTGADAKAAGTQTTRPLLAMLTVFKRNNSIIARSLDSTLLNEMGRIIENLDTPTSQVLLEIKILQLNLDDGFQSFFRFDYADTGSAGSLGNYATGLALGGASVSGSTAFNFVFDSEKLDLRIAFFESKGRVQVFSTPFLMAANNSKVEFFVGEETPLRDQVTSKTITIGEDANNTINTFEVQIKREELGTDVELTPFINDDGTVTLEIDAEISSAILNFSTTQVVNNVTGEVITYALDGVNKTNLKSVLSARSGQSIAIGGIIKESVERNTKKVPLLGDIPYMGVLFRDVDNVKQKIETVIVLTPHVIAHPAMAGRTSDQFLSRKSSHDHITKGSQNIIPEVREVQP